MNTGHFVEHFFRHEYARLVSRLSLRVGVQHFEIIEDAVQSALLTGLESWTINKVPKNPTAWLYAVASNNLIDKFRQQNTHSRILTAMELDAKTTTTNETGTVLTKEFEDDVLRMMFVCCNDSIPVDSQLVLALKTLCGFSIKEIAHRLFTSEANVYQRFNRAKKCLQQYPTDLCELSESDYQHRLAGVHKILYLIFTDGYLSVNNELSIRTELCEEAIRLTAMLVKHKQGQTPKTYALLALMHLQVARISSRQDEAGNLLLLEQQDRSSWDTNKIQLGLAWLEKSAQGSNFSRYHAEAGIAAEHCLAPSFEETRWDRIVESYNLLEQIEPSAVYRLNRAVAVAQWKGPAQGLAILDAEPEPRRGIVDSYLHSAVLAYLHHINGNATQARQFYDETIRSAPTTAVKDLLAKRLGIKH